MPADLPPGWSITPAEDPGHPWILAGDDGQTIGCETQALAAAYAWRCAAEALAAGHAPAPNPAPQGLIRALCDLVGGQRQAARILQVDDRAVRRWCLGEREPSHASAELLRLHAAGRAP